MKIQGSVFGILLLLPFFLPATVIGAECAGQPALKDVFKDDFYIGTALSRDQISGKEPKAIAIAIKINKGTERTTFLTQFLTSDLSCR